MMYMAPAGGYTAFLRRIRLFGITAAVCAICLLGLITAVDYQDRHSEAEMGTLARSRTLAGHAARSLDAVRISLTQMSERLERIWQMGEAPVVVLHELLRRQAATQPLIHSLVLVGADGAVIADSRRFPPSRTDLVATDFVERLVNGRWVAAEPAPVLDTALAAGSGGPMLVPFGRPLADRQGRLRGAIIAWIDPRYFEDFYQGVNEARPMDTGLIMASGRAFASTPVFLGLTSATTGTDVGSRLSQAGDEVLMDDELIGDPARPFSHIVSVSPVAGWPLLSVAAIDRRQLLQGWYRLALPAMVMAILIIIGSVAFVRLISRNIERLSEAEEELCTRIADLEISQARLEDQGAEMVHLAEQLDGARRHAEQAQAQADNANKAKSEFLARMSHELRTPLNAILGFSEIMRDHLGGPDTRQSYVQYAADIHESGSHLLSVISDILDLAKVEAGRFDLAEEEVDLRYAAHAVQRLVRETAHKRELSLVLEIPRDLPRLRSDMRVLKQMLLNLLSNALKFTRPGGHVTLSAARDHGGLTVRVSDTGIGIAEADLAKVMEPFGQARNQPEEHYHGTGLGLPLVKSFIERHGGAFHLASVVDAGTTVSLWFPPERVLEEEDRPSALLAAQ